MTADATQCKENGLDRQHLVAPCTASPDPEVPGAWLSHHLFLGDNGTRAVAAGDRVILQVVEPLVRHCLDQGWIQRFFFIRYHHLGLHLRVRLQGDPSVLCAQVRPALERAAELDAEARRDEYGTLHLSAHPDILHGRWMTYEPEIRRYAGFVGMRPTEALFEASSLLAFSLIAPGELELPARRARALLGLTALLHAMSTGRAHAASMARAHSEYALAILCQGLQANGAQEIPDCPAAFDAGLACQVKALANPVEALWSGLDTSAEVGEPFDAFHAASCTARRELMALHAAGRLKGPDLAPGTEWPRVAQMLVPSHLHMTCNRLGLSILEESYVGHLAARLLELPGEPDLQHQP